MPRSDPSFLHGPTSSREIPASSIAAMRRTTWTSDEGNSPVVVRLEDAELLKPAYLLERARDELGELSRRDPGHGLTLASSDI